MTVVNPESNEADFSRLENQMEFKSDSNGENSSNNVKTPTTPVQGTLLYGEPPRDDVDLQLLKEKIDHQRVDSQTVESTDKKDATSETMAEIQLGITTSIRSLASKPDRDLLPQDFMVMEDVNFSKKGSDVKPFHSNGEFTFKSYAPLVFRHLRDLFDIKPEDFLSSLSEPLQEKSNPGASGSMLYMSKDKKFVIKTIQHIEAECLQKMLPDYYKNIKENPRTLLPQFCGLYSYEAFGKNVPLLIMSNFLPTSIKLHYKFDLKGSTNKRQASKDEQEKETPTMKDLDFLEEFVEGVLLEAPTYEALMKTIQRDCQLLESFKIMDYSLVLAIHNLDQALRDAESEARTNMELSSDSQVSSVLESSVRISMPSNAVANDAPSAVAKLDSALQKIVRQKTMLSTWESIKAGALPADLDDDYPPGGIPARDNKGDRLFIFVGIIDILQTYRFVKELEHVLKSFIHDSDTVSVHRPDFYSNRFQEFMKNQVFKKSKPQVPPVELKKTESLLEDRASSLSATKDKSPKALNSNGERDLKDMQAF